MAAELSVTADATQSKSTSSKTLEPSAFSMTPAAKQGETWTYPEMILVPAIISAIWHWSLLSKFVSFEQHGTERTKWAIAFLLSSILFCTTSPFQAARFVGTQYSRRQQYKVGLVTLIIFNVLTLYVGAACIMVTFSGPTDAVVNSLGVSAIIVLTVIVLGSLCYILH